MAAVGYRRKEKHKVSVSGVLSVVYFSLHKQRKVKPSTVVENLAYKSGTNN